MDTKNTGVVETPSVVAENKKERAPVRKILDDKIDVMSKFTGQIAAAKHEGIESIEATQELIDYLNPRGLNGAKFFIYQGVKVFPVGMTEEIEKELEVPIHERLHGKTAAVFEHSR